MSKDRFQNHKREFLNGLAVDVCKVGFVGEAS